MQGSLTDLANPRRGECFGRLLSLETFKLSFPMLDLKSRVCPVRLCSHYASFAHPEGKLFLRRLCCFHLLFFSTSELHFLPIKSRPSLRAITTHSIITIPQSGNLISSERSTSSSFLRKPHKPPFSSHNRHHEVLLISPSFRRLRGSSIISTRCIDVSNVNGGHARPISGGESTRRRRHHGGNEI